MKRPLLMFSMVLSLIALSFLVGLSACKTLDSALEETSSSGPAILASLKVIGEPGQAKTEFILPQVVTLCGEVVPIDRPGVYERLDKEFQLAANHKAQVELWFRRANRYFPLIEQKLRQAGLPDDLKYLAVAESDLRPTVTSPAGATGIWQFMPATARHFGLKVNREEDLRMLPEPLLDIGMKYLSQLRTRFGDWALAMAAYNSGEARVDQALARQGAGADYYQLRLPAETERYVYRIVAIKIVMENAQRYGYVNTPPSGLYQTVSFTETSLSFPTPTTWPELAQMAGVDYKTLRLLNPHLKASKLSGGPFLLRLPPGAKITPTAGT